MLLRKDPCGIICVILTYSMLIHCLYVSLFVIILPFMNESLFGTLNGFIICTLIILSVISHARAAYSDPGFVPLGKKVLDFSDMKTNGSTNQLLTANGEGWTVCTRCDIQRPPRAHHCRICKRCVRRLDHHCPWVNNCVGEFNQKYFILFLLYIGLICLYAISLTIWSLIVVPIKSETHVAHAIVICIESCLFGIFVIAVCIDQVQSIISDRSLIDQLQMKQNSRQESPVLPPKRVLFRKVFGPGPILFWLIPCDLKSTNQVHDLQETYQV